MKKILVLSLMSFFSTILLAQPIIDGTYFPVRNTRITQIVDTAASNLTIPSVGANQLWDYSSQFVLSDTGGLWTMDISQSPFASSHPAATHAVYSESPLPANNNKHTHIVIDTTGITIVGAQGKSYAHGEFMGPSQLPYGYSNTDTSIVVTTGINTSPPVPYIRNVYRAKHLSTIGYGSLITPIHTYHDVMLAKEVLIQYDSIWVDLGSGYVLYSTSVPDLTNRYSFMRNNTFASTYLMQLTADSADLVVQHGWYTLPVDVGSISGTVYDTTSLPVTNGEMILYREHSNFTKNDILARTTVDGSGNYQFDSIPYGEYRVACRPDLTMYANAMTTYVGDTTDWINCQTIITTGPVSVSNDINLVYHPVNSGAGQISGSLGQDFSYARGSGDPIPGIDIIIEKTPGGTPHHEATTDLTGNFNFGNLDDGSYTVFVDIPGLNMAGSYNFTIAGGTVVGGLDFKVGFDSIHPVGALTTVEAIAIENSFVNVFPNPFSSNATIALSLDEKSKVSITLFNVLGERIEEVVNTELVQGAHTFNYSNTQIPSGVYILKVRVDEEEQVIRMIKE